MPNIRLKDGSNYALAAGKRVIDLAAELSRSLAEKACAALVDGELVDLRTPLDKDCSVEILSFDDEGGRHAFRHTTSHVMAQALQHLYPGMQFSIGPAIEDGFYYDVDYERALTEEELPRIEAEMEKICKQDLPIEYFELPRAEALQWARDNGQQYKVELIEGIPEGEAISFYRQGDFTDLCAGPHLMSTGPIKAVKLLSLAGAYWRGDEHNKMLQRIYGISFPGKAALREYLNMLEEAKRRDHRKLGKEMKLFMLADEGPGFPFWLPNGMVIKNELLNWWRELHRRDGYVEIETPTLLNQHLWETSGHWYHYKDNMYTTMIDDEEYAIKPMNCPGGMLVYKSEQRSYRDLPIRMAELGHVHRHEKSGTLHGLMRVRAFTQDDAHIFMTREQITQEIKGVIRLVDEIYRKFRFDYKVVLSTRPDDFMGEIADWDQAEAALKKALDEMGTEYSINEGDGAFYGPKIDFQIRDSIKRVWQCGTIQLDFQLPQRFEAEYIGADGERHRPIMIHRAILGSIERFIAVLIEHTGGKFPVWLAPEQVRILPISAEKQGEYARQICEQLFAAGIRVTVDERNEKLGYKIRQAQTEKVPYMIIVGDEEVARQQISLRRRDHSENESMSLADFAETIKGQIARRDWLEE